jgi:hypothetical protein
LIDLRAAKIIAPAITSARKIGIMSAAGKFLLNYCCPSPDSDQDRGYQQFHPGSQKTFI